MGSQLVKALIEQRSKQKTNPNNVSPEVSKPIEQAPFRKQTSVQRIEQQSVRSPPAVGGNSPSRPVEQVKVTRATGIDPTVIEQVFAASAIGSPSQNASHPIEQKSFTTQIFSGSSTTSTPTEQVKVQRTAIDGGPIEQVAKIQNTITIEQFNFIDLIFPQCFSIRNPVDTNITVRLHDFGFAFNLSTLIFKVEGLEVQDEPTFITTAITNGVQIDYDPPANFDYNATVSIFIQVEDIAPTPNRFVLSCVFFTVPDTVGPVVENFTLCRTTGVDPRAVVEFDVIDRETGIDPDSIKLSIEGIRVCDGISFSDISTVSGSGFHVQWVHPDAPFRYDSKVTASVEASDNADPPNNLLFVCTFHIRESSPPEFLDIDPAPCSSFVDNTTGLTFELYGVVDGVDISTLEVRVDSQTRKVFVRPRIRRFE